MKIRPLHDRVILRRLEEQETTKGGIIIPDSAKEQQAEGEIISVGPGKMDDTGKFVKVEVKPGERVIFSKYSGTEVKVEGEELLIMREEDILAVIEK
jgi:chaperonin GroES